VSTFDAAINSRRFQKWFPWAAGAVLLAGIVAALLFILPNTGGTTAKQAAPAPGFVPKTVPQQKLLKKVPAAARVVAGRFILTAVQRKNLDQAWPLAGPEVRGGMSRKEWMTGNIAVPVFFGGIKNAPVSIKYATKSSALLEVLLEPVKKGNKPGDFYLKVDKVGKGKAAHWVVNEVQQDVAIPIPSNPNN
jgi:hypothetical protein